MEKEIETLQKMYEIKERHAKLIASDKAYSDIATQIESGKNPDYIHAYCHEMINIIKEQSKEIQAEFKSIG